ncbi:hypothetical protein ACWEOG_18720 [Amycolatopsis japonica]
MSPRDSIEQSAAPPARSELLIDLRALLSGNSTSLEAMDAAQEQADEVGRRRIDIPVRKSFVRSWDEAAPAPLAQIYAGGRSGLVAVKLYLALLWRCAKPPYETDKPARAWATLLDLPDPNTRGARRIASALKTLREANLITTTAQAGHPNLVGVKMEDGSGHAYSPPANAYQFARTDPQKQRHMYFKVARQLWIDGTVQALPGPATVMLLILLAEQADQRPAWFSTSTFPGRYKISHKTRAEGTRQLVARGLLQTSREALASSKNASVYDEVRKRTLYQLTERTFTKLDKAAAASLSVKQPGAVKTRQPGRHLSGKGLRR